MITTPSGLQWKVLREGKGPHPKATDTVTVHPGIYGACHFQVHPVGSDM